MYGDTENTDSFSSDSDLSLISNCVQLTTLIPLFSRATRDRWPMKWPRHLAVSAACQWTTPSTCRSVALCAFTRSLIKSIFSLLILFLLLSETRKKKVDKLQTPVNTTDVLLSGNESRFTMLIPCITASSAWLMLWQLGLTFNDKLSTLYTLGSNAAHRNSSPASERQMEEMPRSFKWTSLTLVAANHWQMIR